MFKFFFFFNNHRRQLEKNSKLLQKLIIKKNIMAVKKDMCDESTDESQSTEENPFTLLMKIQIIGLKKKLKNQKGKKIKEFVSIYM